MKSQLEKIEDLFAGDLDEQLHRETARELSDAGVDTTTFFADLRTLREPRQLKHSRSPKSDRVRKLRNSVWRFGLVFVPAVAAGIGFVGCMALLGLLATRLGSLEGSIASLENRLDSGDPRVSAGNLGQDSEPSVKRDASEHQSARLQPLIASKMRGRNIGWKVTTFVAETSVRTIDGARVPFTTMRPVTQFRGLGLENDPADELTDPDPKKLIDALRHEDELVRAIAADLLNKLPFHRTSALRVPIIEALAVHDDAYRLSAEFVQNGWVPLGKGRFATEEILDALSDSDDPLRRWAALWVLVRTSEEPLQPAEIAPTLSPRPEIQVVEFVDTSDVVRQLVKLLRRMSEPSENRRAAIWLLSGDSYDGFLALDELIHAATADSDSQTRRWAAIAVAKSGPRASNALPALLEPLEDFIARQNEQTVELTEDQRRVVSALAFAVGSVCHKDTPQAELSRVRTVLLSCLKCRHPNVNEWAAEGLLEVYRNVEGYSLPTPATTLQPVLQGSQSFPALPPTTYTAPAELTPVLPPAIDTPPASGVPTLPQSSTPPPPTGIFQGS